jgi:hypothetical protein
MWIEAFWVMTSCSLVGYPEDGGDMFLIALMMEAISTSETSATFMRLLTN